MSETRITRNITIALTEEEYNEIDFLVDFFQEQSITTVRRADVIRYSVRKVAQAVRERELEQATEFLKDELKREDLSFNE